MKAPYLDLIWQCVFDLFLDLGIFIPESAMYAPHTRTHTNSPLTLNSVARGWYVFAYFLHLRFGLQAFAFAFAFAFACA